MTDEAPTDEENTAQEAVSEAHRKADLAWANWLETTVEYRKALEKLSRIRTRSRKSGGT